MTHRNPPTRETVEAALSCIPPDIGHDERVRIAFAVFDALGDAGAELWKAWAAGRPRPDDKEDRATWRSARKPGPVKAATLFGIAREHGYQPEATREPWRRPTADELRQRAAERRAADEQQRSNETEQHRAAAAEARRLWESAAEVIEPAKVPYLARKGIGAHGVRCLGDGTLIVPARTLAGELVNVQRILPRPVGGDGPSKLFLKGGAKSGTLHLIGAGPDPAAYGPAPCAWLLVCEGYATGASLHEATGRAVAVAWDAGNLAPLVRLMRGRWPTARFALCADDDTATQARTGRNPGREGAQRAAKAAGRGRAIVIAPAGLPQDGSAGTDFNDLHALVGLAAVREVVEGAIQAAEAAAPAGKGTSSGKRPNAAPGGRQGRAAGAADEDEPTAARDRFRIESDALWFEPPGDDSGEVRPVKVCGALVVEALGRDAHDNGATLLLQFDTPFRKGRRWLMPLAMLAGDGTAYRAELLARGFMVPTDAKRRGLLTAYLQSRRPAELVRIVDRVGWHGRAYVLPHETLGDTEGERILFQAEAPVECAFSQRGSLERWHELIGRHCIGNSRLGFMVALALAAPLLPWAPGVDGGGFHLIGTTSCGKTTCLHVASSVWGGRQYMQRWRTTDNGLESLAAQHSDALLVLDELGQLDPRLVGESAYMLANGQGKSRATRSGGARPRQSWRLLFASSGEVGLVEYMGEGGKRARAGQELRMIDLGVDAGAGFGAFDHIGEFESGDAMARHLARWVDRVHGHLGLAWLQWLVAHPEDLAAPLRNLIDQYERDFVPDAAVGQVHRVGRRFALVAAAGELAIRAGILAWPTGSAADAVRRCMHDWLAARPAGLGMSEDAQMLRQVRGWLAMHGDSRFKPWNRTDSDNKPNTPLMAGWRKEIMGDTRNEAGDLISVVVAREYFVFPDVFRTEACKGFAEKAGLRLLADRGHLVKEGKHFGCRVSPPGAEKCTLYRIKSSILGDTEE